MDNNSQKGSNQEPVKAAIYWLIVLIPLTYGVINTIINSLPLLN